MKRFQMERPLMVKRWRREWELHGRDFGRCHCGLGMGTMRKHRPQESHPSNSCGLCAAERLANRQDRRRQRYAARALIEEGSQDSGPACPS
jgi:hypothetical protein